LFRWWVFYPFSRALLIPGVRKSRARSGILST
jgi:hypothetical protein